MDNNGSMGNRERGGRRRLAIGLLGGLALVLVGIAALMPKVFPFQRGSEPTEFVAPKTPLLADVLLVALIAILVIAAIMVQISVRRGSYATPLSRRRPVWAQVIVVLIVLWSAALLGTLLDRGREPPSSSDETREGRELPIEDRGERTGSSRVLGLVVTGGLLVLVVGSSTLLYFLGRPETGDRLDHEDTIRRLSEELAAASAALEQGSDPRSAVIACYERLAAILEGAGVARRASDAPFELIERALGDLDVPAASAERLTDLFEVARFSDRDVDESMRDEAVAALGAIRAALEAT